MYTGERKTIKVFLAISDELRDERLHFADLIVQLNSLFERRGWELELELWNHQDESIESYKERLAPCELALSLYYTQMGAHAEEQLSQAHQRRNAGENPRKLYVFFKEGAEQISDELRDFKAVFENRYGHFYCQFENVDTLRLHFLLQLEAHTQSPTEGDLLQVQDQKVLIEGEVISNLNQLSFAAQNQEYIRLRDGIEKLNTRIERCHRRLAKDNGDSDSREELDECLYERAQMQESFEEYQGFLFGLARKASKLAGERISRRSQEAIRLFHLGKASEANAVLNTEELMRDQQENHRLYDEYKARTEEVGELIGQSFKDWLLKVDTALADTRQDMDQSVTEAKNAYERAHADALKLDYPSNASETYRDFLWRYASFLRDRAFYPEALRLYQKLSAICEKTLGMEHLATATSYSYIGAIYNSLGDYARSLNFYSKALAIYEDVLGTQHPDTAATYDNIGAVYYYQSDYAPCLEYYLKALAIYETELGEQHPDTARSNNNIGAVYHSQGDYARALESYLKALAIWERVLGKQHPDTATSYNNIGALYKYQGDYSLALEYHLKALTIREKLLGKQHPDTASSYNNIGALYNSQGDYSLALEFYLKALTIREKVLGKQHSDTASSYNDIASVYHSQQDYTLALEYYLKALSIWKTLHNKAHRHIASSYNNIGSLYHAQGDYALALEYYHEALPIWETVLGKDHPDTATSYNNIGGVYNSQSDYPRAIDYYLKALAIREKIFGKQHPDTAEIYNNMGSAYDQQGDYPRSLEYYHMTLAICEKVFGKEHLNTAATYNNIGVIYDKQDDFTHALEYYLKAHAICEKLFGKEHTQTRCIYDNIAEIQDALAKSKVVSQTESSKPQGLLARILGWFH